MWLTLAGEGVYGPILNDLKDIQAHKLRHSLLSWGAKMMMSLAKPPIFCAILNIPVNVLHLPETIQPLYA